MPRYTLSLNGLPRTVEVEADTPLLWVLRDTLGLVGTKFGCGRGLCGSCTIHLNGQPVRCCVVPIAAVGNQAITTIEGLSPDGTHPLQQAWIDHDVPQCGYCQGGQIMQAAALLRTNSHPSLDDIDSALAGNLCRCGTYVRIRAAVQDAAAVMTGEKGGA